MFIFRVSPRLNLVRPNFNKTPIMASYGIVAFGYVTAAVVSLAVIGCAEWHNAALYLGSMGAMCLLGAIDDIFGNRDVGGFKGHFKKLLFERKLTTGAAKALGGGIVGIIAGYFISGGDPLRWIPAALVVPLSANTLNILDLRPGRAVAVFFVGLVVTCILALGRLRAPEIVGSTAAVALSFAVLDSRAKAMMGDSGSNMLGIALGLTLALNAAPVFQVAAIVLFAAVQLYSEKHSVSALIERNAVLRSIDRRLGVR